MVAKALTIAGSDSGGGAGIQADLKTFSALGVYGASVITAVTAQNTRNVTAVAAIEPPVIGAQIDAVLSDIDIGAIKIGMLFSPDIIRIVAESLRHYTGPVVLDPVMIAKSGDALLQDEAITALVEHLLPRATVVTPNLPELERLAPDMRETQERALRLIDQGAQAVLIKGGHATGETCIDTLVQRNGAPLSLSAPRQTTRNTHGTGCTLSSAIAAGLAKGLSLPEAFRAAHGYLQAAIAAADVLQVGTGHGPVHHFHRMWAIDAG